MRKTTCGNASAERLGCLWNDRRADAKNSRMDGSLYSRMRVPGNSAALASNSDLESFHAFIIAASVHQQQHQETITAFVIAHRKLLNAKPSAFISVSLSAVLEEGQTEAQKYVDRLVSVTDWRPSMTLLLGGALRLTEYDYFQEQIVKFIVLKGGGVASSGRDREFTD